MSRRIDKKIDITNCYPECFTKARVCGLQKEKFTYDILIN